MKKQIIEMELIKECVNSNRYQARGQDIHTVYILKSALDHGEKAPAKILVTIQEAE